MGSIAITVATGSTTIDSITITIAGPNGGDDITLTATSKSYRNWVMVDLSWRGATPPFVEVYRGGALLETTNNDGSLTEKIANTGSGYATYKICESGGDACSSPVSVSC